jgi:hypothetical protein
MLVRTYQMSNSFVGSGFYFWRNSHMVNSSFYSLGVILGGICPCSKDRGC